MPRKFLSLLIRRKAAYWDLGKHIGFHASSPRSQSYLAVYLKGTGWGSTLACSFRMAFINLMTFFFFNLINSLFSSKTTVTHVIRGFLLCQQRGFLVLGNKLDNFSALLQKK